MNTTKFGCFMFHTLSFAVGFIICAVLPFMFPVFGKYIWQDLKSLIHAGRTEYAINIKDQNGSFVDSGERIWLYSFEETTTL